MFVCRCDGALWEKTKEAEGLQDNIWEWNLYRNRKEKKTKVFQFFLLFQLSRHSVNHTTTSPHPVFFFYTDTHIHTHTRDEMCDALRYAALPQSCLAYSWTTDVTEREWLERREEATTVLLEKSVCPQLSVSVSTCRSCLAASQSPELSIL